MTAMLLNLKLRLKRSMNADLCTAKTPLEIDMYASLQLALIAVLNERLLPRVTTPYHPHGLAFVPQAL